MNGTFNAEAFLNQTTLDSQLETKFTPIPAGEYTGLLIKRDAKQMPKQDGSGEFTILELTWQIDDARAKEATGMEHPTVRDSVFLDIDPATGKLESGKNKNVDLGRLCDALGINVVGQNPFQAMPGKLAKLQIVVEPDKKDATKLYNRVKARGKL